MVIIVHKIGRYVRHPHLFNWQVVNHHSLVYACLLILADDRCAGLQLDRLKQYQRINLFTQLTEKPGVANAWFNEIDGH